MRRRERAAKPNMKSRERRSKIAKASDAQSPPLLSAKERETQFVETNQIRYRRLHRCAHSSRLRDACVAIRACVCAGQGPYTPTKLEWLQVAAQTELSENTRCYAVNITKRAPDTPVVVVPYKRCLTDGGADTVARQDVGAVRLLAEGHGMEVLGEGRK